MQLPNFFIPHGLYGNSDLNLTGVTTNYRIHFISTSHYLSDFLLKILFSRLTPKDMGIIQIPV